MKKNIKIYSIILFATLMTTPIFSGKKADKKESSLASVWPFKG
jgi:hypothetical protein